MGLEVWFRADVARILRATFETMEATRAAVGTGAGEGEAYCVGFSAALRAIATAFGVADEMHDARGDHALDLYPSTGCHAAWEVVEAAHGLAVTAGGHGPIPAERTGSSPPSWEAIIPRAQQMDRRRARG